MSLTPQDPHLALKSNSEDDEISLIDIVNFFQGSWKKLAVASFLGATLGLGGWFLFGSYTAEYALINNASNASNASSYALDIISWKFLQKSLPNLAAQIVENNQVPQGDLSLYKTLENDAWWQKNITPSYAISKADVKDLAGIGKDLDSATTTILNLSITTSGSDKEQSIHNARSVGQFIRTGGAYLQLQNLLNRYQGETISSVASLQKQITSTQIEMAYQAERVRQLENLHKRFPANGTAVQQVVDAKDSGAKYLPIQTQIIAANNDINQSKENLKRLSERLRQLDVLKQFLERALPLLDKSADGLALGNQLLAIEGDLYEGLSRDDATGHEALEDLRAQLMQINARFSNGLQANTLPTANKKGMIKITAAGLFIAFALMLAFLLGQKLLNTIRGL